ncbi:hypothetical protein M885DRAFT_507528 [Pelagophyceae sp. CCMP2097]|nr:hypothetical protein M885DRAFT_507528 [Pelagophyceae sp. CCMP2097]
MSWFWREDAPRAKPAARPMGASKVALDARLVLRLETPNEPRFRHYLYFDSWRALSDDQRAAHHAAAKAAQALKSADGAKRRQKSAEAYAAWLEAKNVRTDDAPAGKGRFVADVDGATTAKHARLRAEPERLKWKSKRWRSELIEKGAFATPYPDKSGADARAARAAIVSCRLHSQKYHFVARWCFATLRRYASLRAWAKRKKRERLAVASDNVENARYARDADATKRGIHAANDREKWAMASWRYVQKLELRPAVTQKERAAALADAAESARRQRRHERKLEKNWRNTFEAALPQR